VIDFIYIEYGGICAGQYQLWLAQVDAFAAAVSAIQLMFNPLDSCPLPAVAAVTQALTVTSPYGLIFVFTDATAADYSNTDNAFTLLEATKATVILLYFVASSLNTIEIHVHRSLSSYQLQLLAGTTTKQGAHRFINRC